MKRTPLRRKAKRKKRTNREIDEEFLKHVRALGCSVSGCRINTINSHHLKTRGAGGSDYTCVPLCWKHHAEIHQLGRSKFEEKYSIDLWALNEKIIKEWKK